MWGLDLYGALHGAGGVGGLLSWTNARGTFQYLYDANGNVGQLVNADDGSLAAHYEYDPFGNLLVASGPEFVGVSIFSLTNMAFGVHLSRVYRLFVNILREGRSV